MSRDREELSEEEILEIMRDSDSDRRYQGLVHLGQLRKTPGPEIIRRLREMETDGDRPVRQTARDLLGRYGESLAGEAGVAPQRMDEERFEGSFLFTLCSWGSALTGIITTVMSLLAYFVHGKFPFPAPVNVLLAVNVVFVLPYLVLGVFLLLPGRLFKQGALYYAYFSLVMALVCIGGLLPSFDRWWYYQMTVVDQELMRRFLSPSQLTAVFMPLIGGQSLLIFYLSNLLARRKGSGGTSKTEAGSATQSTHG